ncbi:hypothetical protein BLS_001967 [Venturia inaequalis]|uniref:Uncharacterized protein n=1 Tax=Venturia inaequalis TaxID=5025 RepID=A0A8H3UH62_VENIN|nr:hypothetical protein EG328_006144 [Venturia inaequalis]KAE9984592.1 hypothetical protein BLS_001967 [Venturia inaequalis]KAE9986183.1 hypothetical protein EG327_004433 [Venturia inaequalis]RDI79253.1 hypothetical protein Vi05172_g10703 [Venturia inaequalis]
MHLQTPFLLLAFSTLNPTYAALTTKESGFAFVPMGTSIPPQITNPSQLSAAVSRISAYQTSLTAQSQYTSVGSIIASAIDKNDNAGVEATTTVWEPATTYFGVPSGASWYSGLPADVKGYLSSVASVESRLATGNGACPTGRGVVGVGMAAVVGGLGAVLAM